VKRKTCHCGHDRESHAEVVVVVDDEGSGLQERRKVRLACLATYCECVWFEDKEGSNDPRR